MKRCPQCNTVFEDELQFCKEDGSPLIEEKLPLPSDFSPVNRDEGEQETVIRHQPISFDISSSDNVPQRTQPTEEPPQVNPYVPDHGNFPPPHPPKQSRSCLKYAIFLVIGLIIGGGVVLAIMGVGFFYMNNVSDANQNPEIAAHTENANQNTEKTRAKKSSNDRHSEPNLEADTAKLNGRIIKNRAVLRSSPSGRARRVDVLPNNDRIAIINRKSSSSKWYQIECEHGSRGWIDGYSIEFTE